MKVDVRDPSCALTAMVPTLHRLKTARSGRRRRRFNESALRNSYSFRKPDSWLKSRYRLWSLQVSPTPLPLPPEENPNLLNVKHLEPFFSFFFFLFSSSSPERPLRKTESNVRSSGGPGSVSTGTQASSGKSGTVSADAWVPYETAKCSSETDRGSADPPKRLLGVPPITTKWHLRVQQLPPKPHLRVQQVP